MPPFSTVASTPAPASSGSAGSLAQSAEWLSGPANQGQPQTGMSRVTDLSFVAGGIKASATVAWSCPPDVPSRAARYLGSHASMPAVDAPPVIHLFSFRPLFWLPRFPAARAYPPHRGRGDEPFAMLCLKKIHKPHRTMPRARSIHKSSVSEPMLG